MKTRINKKNETVTITLNVDELWAIRNGLFCAWEEHLNTCATLANEAMKIRDNTDKAFEYLARNW